jgi:hypothetical protein
MKIILKNCPKCGKEFNAYNKWRGELKTCSRSCANSRGPRTEEFKQKVKDKLTGQIRAKFKETQCIVCNCLTGSNRRKTCSNTCRDKLIVAGGSKGGKRSATKQVRRSKQEIELYQLCKSEWNVTHNVPIVDGWDADIILNEYKVAILWNGPWHYKQMPFNNHSLKQVQNRDRIKKQTLEAKGWKVIVFDDSVDTPSSAFNEIKLVVLGGIEPPTNGL